MKTVFALIGMYQTKKFNQQNDFLGHSLFSLIWVGIDTYWKLHFPHNYTMWNIFLCTGVGQLLLHLVGTNYCKLLRRKKTTIPNMVYLYTRYPVYK